MEFKPTEHGESDEWHQLRDLWLDLPLHPHALHALDRGAGNRILLRYAGIDWDREKINLEGASRACARFAAWGMQLTDFLRTIVAEVSESNLGQLLRPFVKIDLDNDARVGFLPVVADDSEIEVTLPPEAIDEESCDERSLVYVIGETMRWHATGLDSEDAAKLKLIVSRCREADPRKRYRTLDDLQTAWKYAGAINAIRTGESLASREFTDEALGWLALDNPTRAHALFQNALDAFPNAKVAAAGRRRALALIAIAESDGRSVHRQVMRRRPAKLAWPDVVERGAKLEAERGFGDALELYTDVMMDGTNDATIYAAIARCHLALRAAAGAIDFAQRALAVESKHAEALSIRARGYLLDHRHQDALKCAETWIAALPEDAAAHYARGRALLALGSVMEARDAFDRACALRPAMLEAILLRREADRSARRLRDTVGIQPEIDIDLPEHLAELRGALVAGRIDDMIVVLERPEYNDDGIAKLLHAQCLAFDARYDDAVGMYDRAAALSTDHERAALLGKAHALLALDRNDEALALFERATSQAPGDLEAIEGRALALRKLGRESEADSELQRVVAASGGRSDLRVRRRPR
jgi:tetratricopeptide (TPR) repeat protein